MKRLTVTLDTDNESSLNDEKVAWLQKKNTNMPYSKLINKAIREYYLTRNKK